MSKLDLKEKIQLKKIAALSNKDKDTIRDVFLALLESITIDLYCATDEVIIPHICKLKISKKYEKGNLEVVLEATPARDLLNELIAIYSNSPTPTEKYIRRQIENKFAKLLKIDDFNILEKEAKKL